MLAALVERWLAPILGAGAPLADVPEPLSGCPHLDWAASGAMALTGEPDGAPALAPGPVLPLLAAISTRVETLSAAAGSRVRLDPGLLLGARAAAAGLGRRGAVSAGGATRLLPARDGWCAVSLARPDDLAAVPAIVQGDPGPDPWEGLADAVAASGAAEICERIRLLGVPASVVDAAPTAVPPWRVERLGPTVEAGAWEDALVVDLSALWAGPLCARVLGGAGARVVKVESTRRPDGARDGDPRFYDWLHGGHDSVSLDFSTEAGRADLRRLIRAADVVIEASRPRALAALGVDPHRDLRPGGVWIGITGYGRRHPDRVAFGDDAAAAGGLVARDARGRPLLCADALADPLTGVVAALGALAGRAAGGGLLLDIAMADVAAGFASAPIGCGGAHPIRSEGGDWYLTCTTLRREQRVLPPRAPRPTRAAALGGAHTAAVLAAV
jgi:hypothetical protein